MCANCIAHCFLILPLSIVGEGLCAVIEIDSSYSISATIREASAGDTILLRDGVYRESVRVLDHSIVIASAYLLEGDSSHIIATIVEAELADPDSASCFIVSLPMTDSLTMIGLTLWEGRGTVWHGPSDDWIAGGGLHTNASRVVIRNSRIMNCSAQRGGGIAVMSNTPDSAEGLLDIQYSSLQNCNADRFGGGLFTFQSAAILQFCTMEACTSRESAGGAHLGGYAMMVACTLRQCGGIMGAAVLESDNSLVQGCLFETNGNPWSFQFFGACHLLTLGNVETRNCIFRGNTSNDAAVVIFDFRRFGVPFFSGNVIESHTMLDRVGAVYLWDCQGEFSHNIVRDGYGARGACIVPSGSVFFHHNIFTGNQQDGNSGGSVFSFDNQGPMPGRLDSNVFEDNVGTVFYREAWIPNPPTIDARNNWWGHESGPFHPTRNPDGQGDTLLLSIVEFEPWLMEPPDTSMSSDFRRLSPGVNSTWRLLSVFPNPFNSTLKIELAGFTRQDFKLTLFDILGREQAVVHTGNLSGGELMFEAPRTLAGGIYFLRASDRSAVETRKIVFLK